MSFREGVRDNFQALSGPVDSSKEMTVYVSAGSTKGLSCKKCGPGGCHTNSEPVDGPSRLVGPSSPLPQTFTFTLDSETAEIQKGSFPYQTDDLPLCEPMTFGGAAGPWPIRMGSGARHKGHGSESRVSALRRTPVAGPWGFYSE